ncbi:MAG: hypothetical protein ABH878_03245, partial [bacterium]
QIHLNDQTISADHIDSLPPKAVGKGSNLIGKVLNCTTTVTDIVPETNDTSITYELTGGIDPFRQTLQTTAPRAGGVIFYTAQFYFIPG